MRRFSPLSFPPRKRGPRNRGGAAATERTSAQWAFRRQDAQALLKSQHPPCCGGRGGSMSFWPPSRARLPLGPGVRRENVGVGKRGPRSHDGAAATERTPAQWTILRKEAPALLKRQHHPSCGGRGWSMSFWPPSRARWPLGPGVRRPTERVGKRGPRSHDGAAATERTSAQRAFRQYDARVLLKTSTLRAAEAVVV